MLRKRSIPVAGKPSPSSSHGGSKSKKPLSPLSLFPNRSLFRSFSSKDFSDHEVIAMNPNSIPEPKHLSFSKNQRPAKPPLELQSEPIGLGIVDALIEDAAKGRRMILFGSQLKAKIPSMDSPSSPIEFGVKNNNSLLALVSPGAPFSPPVFVARSVSVTELEKSEDYTCIISRGPNPKTTHIFGDCVLESCGVDELTAVRKKTSGAGMGTHVVVEKLEMHCKMRTNQDNKRGHWTSPRFPQSLLCHKTEAMEETLNFYLCIRSKITDLIYEVVPSIHP